MNPVIILSSEPRWATRSAAALIGAGYPVAIVSSAEAALEIAKSLDPPAFDPSPPPAPEADSDYAGLRTRTRVPLVVVDDEEPWSDGGSPYHVEQERLIELLDRATAELVSA